MASKKIINPEPQHADGLQILDSAAKKLGFYGKDPVIQPSGAAQAAVSTAAIAAAAGANPTKAEYDALVTRFNAALVLLDALRTAQVNTGLIKGAA